MHRIVIGAGAAGLLCAGFIAQANHEVTVVERNERPARKVLITGKGRCNVTNDCIADEVIRNVRNNPRFLYGAINAFPPAATMEFFEKLSVPLKTERGRRVFPVSDKAVDIADALVRFAKNNKATLLMGKRVAEILVENKTVLGVRLTDNSILKADTVTIATGGCSYPRTGSDGDGYRLAEKLGHTIITCRPSLVPILTRENWCADLAGLSLKNVTLTVKDKKNHIIFSEQGEMLFTHMGISGPLVLSASAYMSQGAKAYNLFINMKPALTIQQLDARILRDFDEFKNKNFDNILGQLLPRIMIPVIVKLSGISGDTKVHSITREQREALVKLLQELPLTPESFGSLDEAVITAGGICVKEINPKTMESKLIKGLYFAGEVIDVDAFTGGYNLQIAFATAYAAAQAQIKPEEGIFLNDCNRN